MYRYIHRVHIATEDSVSTMSVPTTWCLVGTVRGRWEFERWWITISRRFNLYDNDHVTYTSTLPEDC